MSQTYRVYFNAHADAPLVGSIDTGDDTEEINVKSISLKRTASDAISHYRPEKQPKFWFEVHGTLVITDGHAIIY